MAVIIKTGVIGQLQDGRKIVHQSVPGRGAGAVQTQTIEIPELRTIDAVIAASIDGGYEVSPSLCTIAGNKVTIEPMYYDYANVGSGVAIDVPAGTNLANQTIDLIVIGY